MEGASSSAVPSPSFYRSSSRGKRPVEKGGRAGGAPPGRWGRECQDKVGADPGLGPGAPAVTVAGQPKRGPKGRIGCHEPARDKDRLRAGIIRPHDHGMKSLSWSLRRSDRAGRNMTQI